MSDTLEQDIRHCSKCQCDKPLSEFACLGRSPSTGKLHYRGDCCSCRSSYRKAHKEKARESIEAYAPTLLWGVANRTRIKSLSEVAISKEWIIEQWALQGGRCFYSNVEMTITSGPRLVTVERLDVKRGYSPDNCVLACYCINMMRGCIPLQEFSWWCRKVSTEFKLSPKEP